MDKMTAGRNVGYASTLTLSMHVAVNGKTMNVWKSAMDMRMSLNETSKVSLQQSKRLSLL